MDPQAPPSPVEPAIGRPRAFSRQCIGARNDSGATTRGRKPAAPTRHPHQPCQPCDDTGRGNAWQLDAVHRHPPVVRLDLLLMVTRRIWMAPISDVSGWPHARGIIRVQSERSGHGVAPTEDRYYLRRRRAESGLHPTQGQQVIRSHWAVENSCHWTHLPIVCCVAFGEDDRRWVDNPQGMMVLQVLRRIICNLLALFRGRPSRLGVSTWGALRAQASPDLVTPHARLPADPCPHPSRAQSDSESCRPENARRPKVASYCTAGTSI